MSVYSPDKPPVFPGGEVSVNELLQIQPHTPAFEVLETADTPPLRKFTAFFPVYNEAERVAAPGEKPGENYVRTLTSYMRTLDNNFSHRDDWGLAIVDDGSRLPTTQTIARQWGVEVIAATPNINRGRGAAYQLGFTTLAPKSRIIGAYDGDGSYPPETALDHYEALRDGKADMAIAFRPEHDSQHENMARAKAHKYLREIREKVAYTGLKDTQAGAFTLSAEAALFLFDRPISPRWAANHQIARIATLAGMEITELEQEIIPKGGSTVGESYRALGAAATRQVLASTLIGVRHNRLSNLDTQWRRHKSASSRSRIAA